MNGFVMPLTGTGRLPCDGACAMPSHEQNSQRQISRSARSCGTALFPFRGVVFDIDPVFNNTEEWYQSIPAEVRPHKDQPFYHLFAENAETEYIAYVSEQNLLPDTSGEPVRHPQVAEVFEQDRRRRLSAAGLVTELTATMGTSRRSAAGKQSTLAPEHILQRMATSPMVPLLLAMSRFGVAKGEPAQQNRCCQSGLDRNAEKAGPQIFAKSVTSRATIPRRRLVDNMIAPVDIQRFPGDEAGRVVRQEGGSRADILDADQAARRRLRPRLLEQFVEFRKSRKRPWSRAARARSHAHGCPSGRARPPCSGLRSQAPPWRPPSRCSSARPSGCHNSSS